MRRDALASLSLATLWFIGVSTVLSARHADGVRRLLRANRLSGIDARGPQRGHSRREDGDGDEQQRHGG